jgi:hypothetical protein
MDLNRLSIFKIDGITGVACKCTEPNPYRLDRTKDIKCGVAVNTLRNFVRVSFSVLSRKAV